MNLFLNILLYIILILFPLFIYLLYDAYNKIYDLKKSDLFLDFAIITSFYLVFTFKIDNFTFPYLIMNVPLVLAYLKKRNISILILSFLCCLVLYDLYHTNISLFFLEYFAYYIAYNFTNKKGFSFINIFVLLKVFFYCIYEFILKYHLMNIDYILNLSIMVVSFIIITYIIVLMFKKVSEIIIFNQDSKVLEEEKKLRMSLFKITHEIKNPITVCKGYLDMFDFNDIKKSKKFIRIIKDEINRVLILLEDFLSINKIKIEKDIIDLNLLLEEVTNSFIPILKDKGIDRIFHISKDELFINADYNRLNQVLINIIKNSIEAIEDNGVICIYTKVEKDIVKIHIEDNGIGMDSDELNKIMEPFFTNKQNGNGLGVYLSNQIIEAHGGKIEYISKKNIGTKTIISLPYEEIDL